MANVFTGLTQDAFKAADIVGRKLVGCIASANVNKDTAERVEKGGTIKSSFTRAPTVTDYVTSMTLPEGTDQTVDKREMTLDFAREVIIPWTGEEEKALNTGIGYQTIYGDQLEQTFEAIAQEIEIAACTEAYTQASRAVGTAGSDPMASNFDIIADARKELVDNGCNMQNVSMVLNTLSGASLRKQTQLQKVNEAGTDRLLRNGELLNLQQMSLNESAGIQTHTIGTGAGYLVNATLAVGDSVITVDTGTGTILVGDVVTFAGDTTKYVVTEALSGSTFTIGTPGLLVAPADNAAITVGAAYTGMFAFQQQALEIAVRAPALNAGGDAGQHMQVGDPFSGLTFDLGIYKGKGKNIMVVSVVYGVKAWKPDNIINVLG